jgi:hypothetical protein
MIQAWVVARVVTVIFTLPQLECLINSPTHGNLVAELLLTIIMSNERLSDNTRMRKIAGSFKGKLSSILHLSRAPTASGTPSSIDMDSSSDNRTK